MAMASTFIPGLNPQNPHYIPGYTGHCPLLRFSMGQTYGQMTGQLLRSSPGLAWPPAHRTLLPPIRPPRSPEAPRKSLPVRRGHERLSSSMIPGYTGFVPQAQFIFAKNRSQVWAEALNDFTQWYGGQRSQELSKEAEGEKDVEKDQEPKLEAELETEKEPELGQEAEQKASPYSMDDRDPRKFFMSGPTLRTWAFYLNMGAMCQGISSSLAAHMGISPMMLWASAPSRSSSWRRYLDFKFSLSFSSYPSHPFAKKKDGLEGGRRHKERMVWRPSTFFINRCNK
ncbi:ciliary microtubule inner protein 2B isoform X1 [Balaenoptera ricei]|uniref:ciliary microtubule inner protein 2B isoform X1 n=2 Tax=Balaenoptera ricei TaxID=2746895 RepID=UPI0028BD73C8|nr:ciliary microtubule inner protein 2B isoform X1 [Balaenoptera ricei]